MTPTSPSAPPPPAPAAEAPGLNLGDILYTIFRHKWKIAIISLAAVLGAAGLHFFWPVPYQSEARLFVRYVVDTKSPAQLPADASTRSPDQYGANVMGTEAQILTSIDLAQQVADLVGPEKILGKAGGTNRSAAAWSIVGHLVVDVPKNSDVIDVTFKHPDPVVVQAVLSQLIDSYLKKHVEIHRALGVYDDFLSQQTDQLRSRLATTEDELRKAKAKVGVMSIEDSKKLYSEQLGKIQLALLDAESELAARQAIAGQMARLNSPPGAAAPANIQSNSVPATNLVAAVAPETVEDYHRVRSQLEGLSKREQELLLQFTPENSQVKSVQEQIAAARKQKQQLEAENPQLLAVKAPEPMSGANPGAGAPSPQLTLAEQMAQVAGLQSKVQTLNAQLEQLQKQAGAIYDAEGTITELQRKKDLEESQYRYFYGNREQARIDDQLGAAKNANISVIQAPSPPFVDGKKKQKLVLGVLFGGIACAFGLAFALELFLDPTLKRPVEIETRLKLPLFLTIPNLRLTANRTSRLLGNKPNSRLLPQPPNGPAPSDPPPSTLDSRPSTLDPRPSTLDPRPSLVPWSEHHPIRAFSEALRDRLIAFFEARNLTHKPKLVAVTSCGEGAGVSTIAAGLAASLSETGEGNVLLVDMNEQHGKVQQFFQGDLNCGLDTVLETEKRDQALVQDNLYYVSEAANGRNLSSVLPKRFKSLVPRLKASDYDYIIFDMPPVSQISLTPRLAHFMDTVLLVVESEKTDREVVKRASALLTEHKANVGLVLNKTRSYVPKLLQQEL